MIPSFHAFVSIATNTHLQSTSRYIVFINMPAGNQVSSLFHQHILSIIADMSLSRDELVELLMQISDEDAAVIQMVFYSLL